MTPCSGASTRALVRYRCLRALCLLGAAGLLAAAAHAQPAGEVGSIRGRVLDAVAATPLGGVAVTLMTEAGEESRTTDSGGDFEFAAVPAARYRVRFQKTGYREATLDEVEVQPGRAARADASLSAVQAGTEPGAPVDLEEFRA
jgi:hypothetical protein